MQTKSGAEVAVGVGGHDKSRGSNLISNSSRTNIFLLLNKGNCNPFLASRRRAAPTAIPAVVTPPFCACADDDFDK